MENPTVKEVNIDYSLLCSLSLANIAVYRLKSHTLSTRYKLFCRPKVNELTKTNFYCGLRSWIRSQLLSLCDESDKAWNLCSFQLRQHLSWSEISHIFRPECRAPASLIILQIPRPSQAQQVPANTRTNAFQLPEEWKYITYNVQPCRDLSLDIEYLNQYCIFSENAKTIMGVIKHEYSTVT